MSEKQKQKPLDEGKIISQWDNLFPSPQELETISKVAKMALASGFLGKDVCSAEKAEYIIMKGKELGIPPILALTQINVIQGKISVSAELMLTLVRKNCPNARIEFVELSNTKCIINAQRPPERSVSFKYTIEDAATARLIDKQGDMWKKYPRAMLRSRCVSECCRSLFSDALMGASYTPEELGAVVSEEGEVLNLPKDSTPSKYGDDPSTWPDSPKPTTKQTKRADVIKDAPTTPAVDPQKTEIIKPQSLPQPPAEELQKAVEKFDQSIDELLDHELTETETLPRENPTETQTLPSNTPLSWEQWMASLQKETIGRDTWIYLTGRYEAESPAAFNFFVEDWNMATWFPKKQALKCIAQDGTDNVKAIKVTQWILEKKKADLLHENSAK